MHEVVFSHARVVDGTGAPSYLADVAVDGERITAIQSPGSLPALRTIPAGNLVLAPGFIDFHSHSDFALSTPVQEELLTPFLEQGVTTFVGGNCGFSPFPAVREYQHLIQENSLFLLNDSFAFRWETMDGFMNDISESGLLLNTAFLVGHGSLRTCIKGNDPSPLTAEEHIRLRALIHEAKEQGAIGVSLGLAYIPGMFADEDELMTVFSAAARENLLVTIHGHTYSWTSPFYDQEESKPHNIRDIELLGTLALKTGAKVHASHLLLKGSRTWETLPLMFETIEELASKGVDITFGVIPYHWGNTLVKTLLPHWFLEHYDRNVTDPASIVRLKQELESTERLIGRNADDLFLLWGGESGHLHQYEGLSFQEIASLRSLDATETILWIIQQSGGAARILTASYSGKEGEYSEPLHRLMQHERAFIEIDAIVTDLKGPQTPAAYGAFPRFIGSYARDKGLFSLEKAVHIITGKAADRLGLKERGVIAVGGYADLVLFDPEAIREGDPLKPGMHAPKGIHQVWIQGVQMVERGTRIQAVRPGRILRAGE